MEGCGSEQIHVGALKRLPHWQFLFLKTVVPIEEMLFESTWGHLIIFYDCYLIKTLLKISRVCELCGF